MIYPVFHTYDIAKKFMGFVIFTEIAYLVTALNKIDLTFGLYYLGRTMLNLRNGIYSSPIVYRKRHSTPLYAHAELYDLSQIPAPIYLSPPLISVGSRVPVRLQRFGPKISEEVRG